MRASCFYPCTVLILWTTSFFCAGQIAPSGGPPDTTPPQIVESSPEPGTLQFHGQSIAFIFNKYVDRTSFEQSLFISPPLGRLAYDWGGKEVEIKFSEPLRTATTYVVTIGTDFHDTRNNRLPFAYALAFSTGGRIDSGSVSGVVEDAKAEGVMIFAYRLAGRERDTLNPSHTTPDYITQTGKMGAFTLPNMAFGEYRVIAVRDQSKDLFYDVQADEYGVAHDDVSISPARRIVAGMVFAMTKEDTLLPFLSSARGIDRDHVLLRFSEPLEAMDLSADSVIVVDTVRGERLACFDIAAGPSSPAEIEVTTAPQESLTAYRVTISGVRDLAGNPISRRANAATFAGVSRPDTLSPLVDLVGVADSTKNLSWDDTLNLSITKGVHRLSFQNGFSLLDQNGSQIAGAFRWAGSSSVGFIPSSPLEFGRWHSVRIILDSVADYTPRRYHDSAWVRHFRVVEEKFLGSINGRVIDEGIRSNGRIHIIAQEIANRNVRPREIVIDSATSFRFPYLPEGKYVLSAFRDRDSNGVYTFGSVFPFRPSERFVPPADTLKVRARWPLDGVVVRFP